MFTPASIFDNRGISNERRAERSRFTSERASARHCCCSDRYSSRRWVLVRQDSCLSWMKSMTMGHQKSNPSLLACPMPFSSKNWSGIWSELLQVAEDWLQALGRKEKLYTSKVKRPQCFESWNERTQNDHSASAIVQSQVLNGCPKNVPDWESFLRLTCS